MRGANGRVLGKCKKTCSGLDGWGNIEKLIERSVILDEVNNILQDGALIGEMTTEEEVEQASFHLPPNPAVNNLLQMLESGCLADVFFQVDGTTLSAHRLMLEANAPVLASFFEGADENMTVQINGTTPNIFQHTSTEAKHPRLVFF